MFRNYRGNSDNGPYPADMERVSLPAAPITPRNDLCNDLLDAVSLAAHAMMDRTQSLGVPDITDELGEMVRRQAAHEALVESPARREAEHANRILKKHGGTLEPVKEKLRMARKPRMRTVEQYLCDICDTVISKPTDGYIVHGNIYVAEPSCRGGLIGNNFPEPEADGTIKADGVKQTVFCKACFLKALGLEPPAPKLSTPKDWEGSSAVARDSIRRNPYNGNSGTGSRY